MNKQIEEMASIIGDCKNIPDEICDKHLKCADCKASRCYNAGYRKASEVAREIFAEIGKILYKYDQIAERDKSEYGELIVGDIGCAIGELKKKYTEVGE